ncbi:MAG: hypothetical protein DRO14_00220 [Thermoprotei archaeon]|nr:MAG: hypothetical protein DRO14_00215 [Thermoprotei archaeon]RLG78573.1 MAG: hypothetical protein DRO14_00220 [Thermoprotei archaeon]
MVFVPDWAKAYDIKEDAVERALKVDRDRLPLPDVGEEVEVIFDDDPTEVDAGDRIFLVAPVTKDKAKYSLVIPKTLAFSLTKEMNKNGLVTLKGCRVVITAVTGEAGGQKDAKIYRGQIIEFPESAKGKGAI